MLQEGITVVIPTIPPRAEKGGPLERAIRSVAAQKLLPVEVIVEYDCERTGAMATRNRGLARVKTEWVAFLDDDDEFKPDHLQACMEYAQCYEADMVYPWFEQPEMGWDGLGAFGERFEDLAPQLESRNWIPVTALVRTEALLAVGGFQYPFEGATDCEDWGCWRALYRAGYKIVHMPQRTWIWHHWYDPRTGQGNTSGKPDRW